MLKKLKLFDRDSDKKLKKTPQSQHSFLKRLFQSSVLGISAAILTAIPANAAERLFFTFGPLRLSIGIDSLEEFAEEGTINKELAFYFDNIKEEEIENFREVLVRSQEVNPIHLYRFFRTPMGEQILERIGNLITIQGGQNGQFALRGAVVQAAASPEGLSVLNFLRNFPTNIQLNTEDIVEVAKVVDKVARVTEMMVKEMERLSNLEAAKEEQVDYSQLLDIRNPGKFEVEQNTVTLKDSNRDRTFYVDIYKPQTLIPGKTPVIIASHGLASDPKNFQRLGNHLATYGFLVAAPQHPGSDFAHVESMLQGFSSEIFNLEEFTDRPADISYVIDYLEQQNQSQFQGRLDLENVGVVGHSFGGYTVLALAGAKIDFDNLEGVCATQKEPNISLLLQCRALELPRKEYDFRDDRVKGVIAFNPVNSIIFGQRGLSQISIPVFIGAGSNDPATPLLFEQIRSFPWLTGENKYLALEEGQAHVDFSQLDGGADALLNSFPELTLPDPELLNVYSDSMALAFFKVHIANNPEFFAYLRSSYANYISISPFELHLVSTDNSIGELEVSLQQLQKQVGLQ